MPYGSKDTTEYADAIGQLILHATDWPNVFGNHTLLIGAYEAVFVEYGTDGCWTMSPMEGNESPGRCKVGRKEALLVRTWSFLSMVYYRYTLEVGIVSLEWWEAVIVNLYFLLLLYSLSKQIIWNGVYVVEMAKNLLAFLKNSYSNT